MDGLLSQRRLYARQLLTLYEVERMLRLLLIHRSGNPRWKFHFTGRRYLNEIGDLSADPGFKVRRYEAGVSVGPARRRRQLRCSLRKYS